METYNATTGKLNTVTTSEPTRGLGVRNVLKRMDTEVNGRQKVIWREPAPPRRRSATRTESSRLMERGQESNPRSKGGNPPPRAADTSRQFSSPRNKARSRAGKHSVEDAAEFRRKV